MSLRVLLLTNPETKKRLEQVLEQLVEREVAGKQGVEGKLIQMVHSNCKKLIPNILPRGIAHTLPFLLDDLEAEYVLAPTSFAQHLQRTDRRHFITKAIKRAFDRVVAQHPILAPLYALIQLRIEHHVALALPQLAVVLRPFTG